jgi:hypothetical protein
MELVKAITGEHITIVEVIPEARIEIRTALTITENTRITIRIIKDIIAEEDTIVDMETETTIIEAIIIVVTDSTVEAIITAISISVIVIHRFQPTIYIMTIIINT